MPLPPRRDCWLAGWAAVVLGHGFADRAVGCDDGFNVQTRAELDVVHREDVGGIRHRERERIARARDGNDVVLGGGFAGNQADEGRVEFEIAQIDGGHAVLPAEDVRDVLVFQEAQLDESRPEPAAVGALMRQRFLQLSRSDALLAQ